jgi:hypothetical protein
VQNFTARGCHISEGNIMTWHIEYSLDLADFNQRSLSMSAVGLILRAAQPKDDNQLAELPPQV